MIIMGFLNLGLNLAYNQTLTVFNSSKIHPENRPTHLKMSTWRKPSMLLKQVIVCVGYHLILRALRQVVVLAPEWLVAHSTRCLQCAFSRLTLLLGGLPNAQLTHDQGFPGTENLFIIQNHRERLYNVLDIWLLYFLLKVLAKDSEADLHWILFAKEKILSSSFSSWEGLIFS